MRLGKTMQGRMILAASLMVGVAGLTYNGTAFSNKVVNSVHVGGNDFCEPAGCDKNFSLTALKFADGTVKGQFTDRWPGSGRGFHATLDCLTVGEFPPFPGGAAAWVSGTITQGTEIDENGEVIDLAGQPVWAGAIDFGQSTTDIPDLITFSFVDDPTPCYETPAPSGGGFLDRGQVKIK